MAPSGLFKLSASACQHGFWACPFCSFDDAASSLQRQACSVRVNRRLPIRESGIGQNEVELGFVRCHGSLQRRAGGVGVADGERRLRGFGAVGVRIADRFI